MKCVAIGGVPATGKTTLMKYFYDMKSMKNFDFGLVKGHYNDVDNIILFGLYNLKGTFLGTDKLSMGVNKQFLQYIEHAKDKRNIIFEGDRLFSLNNLIKLNELYDLRIIILKQPEEVLKQRHIDRQDTQTDKFLKGRTTKIKNIEQHFKDKIEHHTLSSLQESEKLAINIYNELRN